MAGRIAAKAFNSPKVTQAIGLSGLPRTALPSDLRRLCGKYNVENVAHVGLDYKRFRPTGTAVLVFTRPEFIDGAMNNLRDATLGGKKLTVFPISSLPDPGRSRGSRGFVEAGRRGSIQGDGPDAGLTGGGKNVIIFNLPPKEPPFVLVDRLRDFNIVGMDHGKPAIVKLQHSPGSRIGARVLVRLDTLSDAHRLVRALHMQKWRPESYGDRYTLHANIVW